MKHDLYALDFDVWKCCI